MTSTKAIHYFKKLCMEAEDLTLDELEEIQSVLQDINVKIEEIKVCTHCP